MKDHERRHVKLRYVQFNGFTIKHLILDHFNARYARKIIIDLNN